MTVREVFWQRKRFMYIQRQQEKCYGCIMWREKLKHVTTKTIYVYRPHYEKKETETWQLERFMYMGRQQEKFFWVFCHAKERWQHTNGCMLLEIAKYEEAWLPVGKTLDDGSDFMQPCNFSIIYIRSMRSVFHDEVTVSFPLYWSLYPTNFHKSTHTHTHLFTNTFLVQQQNQICLYMSGVQVKPKLLSL